ncbi:MAG TPA: response regulator [Pirellulales bacterium]|nr:response regulator [Pirellulales bacterium]
MNEAPARSTRPLILCIDDDPAIIAALQSRFLPYDLDFATAYCGAQGIWRAITDRPDLIVTDLCMPNGNGESVVECLRKRDDTRAIPIIVFTGTRQQDARSRMLSLGVEGYVQKPAAFNSILNLAEKFVALRAAAR